VIGAIAQELIDEIPVSRMDLDPVEAGGKGVLSSAAVLIDDARNFIVPESAGRHKGFQSLVCVRLTRRPDRRGCHRQGPIGLQRRMGDPTHVPEL
jgi:hypothetical protein